MTMWQRHLFNNGRLKLIALFLAIATWWSVQRLLPG